MSVFNVDLSDGEYFKDLVVTAVKHDDALFACNLLDNNINYKTDKTILISILENILKPNILKPPLSGNVLLNKIADLDVLNGEFSNNIFKGLIFRKEGQFDCDDYGSEDIDFIVNELGLRLDISKMSMGSYNVGSDIVIIENITHCLKTNKLSAANYILEELRSSGKTLDDLSPYKLIHSYFSNYISHRDNEKDLLSVKGFYKFISKNIDVLNFNRSPVDGAGSYFKSLTTAFSKFFSKDLNSTQSMFGGGCLSKDVVLGRLIDKKQQESYDYLFKIIKKAFNKETLKNMQAHDNSNRLFFSVVGLLDFRTETNSVDDYVRDISKSNIVKLPLDGFSVNKKESGKISKESDFLNMFYTIGLDNDALFKDSFNLDLNAKYDFIINGDLSSGSLPFLFFEYINSITKINIGSSYAIEKVFDFTYDLDNILEDDIESISKCLQKMIDDGFDLNLKNNKTKKTNLRESSFGDALKKWASEKSSTSDSFKKFCTSVLNKLDDNSLKKELIESKVKNSVSFKL